MNLFRHPQSRRDEVHVVSRSRDALLRLLLKRMQDVDGIGEPNRIDRPVRIAIEVIHNLQYAASLETLERLGVDMFAATLRLKDREPHQLPDRFRELLEVIQGRSDPDDILGRARMHDGIIPYLG